MGDGGGTAALRNGNGNGLAGLFTAVYLARHRDDPHRNEQQEEQQANADPEIDALVAARTAAKKAKNFAEADRIRDELKAKGIEIIDTPQGAKWRKV